MSWRCIEVVITSRTRNAVVGQPARGFEPHRLRFLEYNGKSEPPLGQACHFSFI